MGEEAQKAMRSRENWKIRKTGRQRGRGKSGEKLENSRIGLKEQLYNNYKLICENCISIENNVARKSKKRLAKK